MTSYNDPRRIFWIGLSIMFILIGIAAVLGVIFSPHNFTALGFKGKSKKEIQLLGGN